jgi:hypothetical protein
MATVSCEEIWLYVKSQKLYLAINESHKAVFIAANTPIRIQPGMLLFPNPSALKEIYWDPKCNQKSGLYGTGILGPPHLFTTLDGDTHRSLRKALAGPPV